MKDFYKNILKDVQVDLTDEFDQNFERKAFFGDGWKETKHANARGSLMMRSGALRRSIRGTVQNESIQWTSSLPYASIHNEGGEITVTAKMKSFFWAMYYKSAGAITKGNSQRNIKLTGEAAKWKNMALMKIGAKMKIEQRQFIGDHPRVRQSIELVVNRNMKHLEDYLRNNLRR